MLPNSGHTHELKRPIASSIPVELRVLNGGGLFAPARNSAENVAEVIWAVANFIYTGDSEVSFLKFTHTHAAGRLSSSHVHYEFDDGSSAATVASSRREETRHQGSEEPALRHDNTLPSFTKLAKKVALLFTENTQASDVEQQLRTTYEDVILLHFDSAKGSFIHMSSLEPSENSSSLAQMAETIRIVGEVVRSHNWTTPLEQLSFLGPENWEQIRTTAVETVEVADAVVGDILAKQSRERPDKLAVETWDGNLTYAQLYDYARRMAAFLLMSGAQPEDRIGICMSKSKWAAVTIWGILLAGCTAVPLDIRNPPKRTEALLQSVNARYVVADELSTPPLQSLERFDVGILPCHSDLLDIVDASDPSITWPQVSPSAVAFINFTSGSTGTPKGVTTEHGPLFASIHEVARRFFLDDASKTFQFSSFTSDVSSADIFATMSAGGTVFFPSEDERLSSLAETLGASKASHALLTSSVMSQLQPDQVPHLRYLIGVGETVSKDNLTRWSPHVCVITAYGTTESSVFDGFAYPEHLATDFRSIGLGGGPCIWITDFNNPENVMPIGAVGEILIEGPLLAREYVGAPELTAAKFIPAPTWLRRLRGERPDHRCYRSGDHGIRNADGTVLYLGRADNQIKIRGQRVELSEIEHSLLVCDDRIQQAAVEMVRLENRGQDEALIAFIQRPDQYRTDNSEAAPPLLKMDAASESLFRDIYPKLLQEMPSYMVPTLFVPIRSIPTVGALRKRDRKALRRWGASLTTELLQEYRLRLSPPTMSARMPSEEEEFEADPPVIPSTEPFELIPSTVSKESCLEEAARICQISPKDIQDMYPATPMQEALMAISSHRKNTYSHSVSYRLPGSVDVVRFKAAWETLVASEPIFRTRLVTLPNLGTWQVVVQSNIDWHESMTLVEYEAYDRDKNFAYGTELSRYALVREADDNAARVFVWSGHHAIADGWSRQLMFDEINHIYLHGMARARSPYTPYIKFLSQTDMQESIEFWREQSLDAVDSFPALPSPDFVPEAKQVQTVDMKLNRQYGSTISRSTLIQAAWALVSSSYANTEEAIFGLTLSGRDAPVPGVEETMGLTITTVPVRITYDSTSSIAEYLEEVQQHIEQVRQHQNLGLQNIARLSDDAKSATAFQSLLVVQPSDGSDEDEPMESLGLELIRKEETDTLDRVLTLQIVIDSDRLQIKAHFDDRVIPRGQMECILALFEHIINQLATESAEQSLHELDRMSSHDRKLISSFNDQMPPRVNKTLHGMFEERARSTPDAVALESSFESLTYAELDRRANSLAKYLAKHTGGAKEPRIILCFTKSMVPIISMLATLKLGGVCASVNPERPISYLADQCRDVDAALVLCDDSFVNTWKEQDSMPPVLGINDALIRQLAAAPSPDGAKTTLLPSVDPENAAFIIYTSGTTGKPKASVLEHRNLATGLSAVGDHIGLGATCRTLQFSAYTFDAHILEIFTTLGRGGCVCVISDHERMNSLAEAIEQRHANFALLTKSVARLLEPEDVPSIRTLILSGEANGRQDYQSWAPHVRLFNGLGPSECTPLVCLTKQPVSNTDDPSTIGHSLGCRIWITNHRRPDLLVPVGCVGEMTIEGPIVGRGYVNRDKQNAASFIQDPKWSREQGSGVSSRRFYRSGDLARMKCDGSITFLGRADKQVKIHGQRVELEEIEDHLRRQSEAFANSAVEVLTVSSRGGASVLAVFCTRERTATTTLAVPQSSTGNTIMTMNEGNPHAEETRAIFTNVQSKLLQLLPQYMVPSVFIPVARLPINASGKMERKKLHQWADELDTDMMGDYYLIRQSVSSSVPETALESRLRTLWAKVLNVPLNSIYGDDNFFRRGGDSVLSMQLIATARAEGISMTVADVFKEPVLRDMALTMIDAGQEVDKPEPSGPPDPFSVLGFGDDVEALRNCVRDSAQDCGVAEDDVEDMYPCTPAQEALMAVSSHRPKAFTYQVVLKLPAGVDLTRFKEAWESLVATYGIYRTRIVFRRGMGSLQVVLRAGNIAWRSFSGMSLDDYLKSEGQLLVEYGSELCKFALLRPNSDDSDLTFIATLHHAVYDGWSMMKTWQEWTRFYRQGEGQPAPTVTPYSAFFRYTATINKDEMDEFWKQQFPTIVRSYPELPSPTYMPNPKKVLSSTVACAKNHHESGVTMATMIQAAWALLLSKYSHDNDEVIFGHIQSGRDAPVDGITDMIGPTIATVPLRVHLEPSLSLNGLLGRIQSNTALIRKFQQAGLQNIRRLSPEASAGVQFQSLLTVHTMSDGDIKSSLAALGIKALNADAKEFLDLALTLECTIEPDRLEVRINYDNGVVADGEAAFILRHFGHVITTLLDADGDTKLQDLSLVSAGDIQVMRKLHALVAPRSSPENGVSADKQSLHQEESAAQKDPILIGEIEKSLQLVWSQVLDLDQDGVDVDDSFTLMGGHSITAMQVVSECRRIGIKLKVSTILEKKTIKAIAPHCALAASFGPAVEPADTEADNELFELSPIQRHYFESEAGQWTRLNQGFLCRLRKTPKATWSAEQIRSAFDAVVARHAMLRARFHQRTQKDEAKAGETDTFKSKSRWMQLTVPAATPDAYQFRATDMCSTSDDDKVLSCVSESQASIEIENGPVFSVELFEYPQDQDDMVYMVAHHLVIDLVSWRIIFRDFEEALRKGGLSSTKGHPLSFLSWNKLQQKAVESLNLPAAEAASPVTILASHVDFWGIPQENNIIEHETIQSFSLSQEMTGYILGKANEAMRTSSVDILAGLLSYSFKQVFHERDEPAVCIEHHGRELCDGNREMEDVDLAQTVGWFTTLQPVHAGVSKVVDPIEAIRLMKDARSRIPRNGQTDFAARHLAHGSDTVFVHQMPAEIVLNYAGGFQQLESAQALLQRESRVVLNDANGSDPKSHRFALINLEASVTNSVMKLSFHMHDQMAHLDRLRQWISLFRTLLEETIPRLATTVSPTYTLGDFPLLAGWDFDDLQDLLERQLPASGLEPQDLRIQDILPCTSVQEGILISSQHASGSNSIYGIDRIWEFTDLSFVETGELLPGQLRNAWDALVLRHSSLRSGIVEHATSDGNFVQVVLERSLPSRFVEVSECIRDASVLSQLASVGTDKGDESNFWTHMPILSLYRTETGGFACRLKLSHALVDGASLDLIMKELTSLLAAQSLPSSHGDFTKYVEYERRSRSDQSLDYWVSYLEKVQPCCLASTKSGQEEGNSGLFDRVELPGDVATGIAAFARRMGVTQAALIQAAWAIVLSVFTGQDDVCFSYMASGRDAPISGIQGTIGLLVSMQYCRVNLSGGKTQFSDVVHGVATDMIRGLQHRNCSLAHIKSKLGVGSTSLFDTCVTVRSTLEDEAYAIPIKTVDGAQRTEYTIALDASVGNANPDIGLSYKEDVISTQQAKSIAGCLETVLRGIVQHEGVNQSIGSLEVIGDDDRQLIEGWNKPALAPLNIKVHGLIEKQTKIRPDKIATSGFDGDFTYAQIDNMVCKLAAHLSRCGLRHRERVVLCFAKSTLPVVAMLAVLKAGGVCVPTDAQEPTARLAKICRDAETSLVLCDDANASRFRRLFRDKAQNVVALSRQFLTDLAEPTTDLSTTEIGPTDAAFVIYTPSSVGELKGSVLNHDAIAATLQANSRTFNITENTRAVQFAPYSHITSIYETLGPLISGACTCVISEREHDLEELAGVITDMEADWIMLPPTVAERLSPEDVPTLSTLVLREELGHNAPDVWADSNVRLIHYWSMPEYPSAAFINTNVTRNIDRMNIGKLYGGCSAYIVDQSNPQRLLPLGCVGELLISAPGQADAMQAASTTIIDKYKPKGDHGTTSSLCRTSRLGKFNQDGSVTLSTTAARKAQTNGKHLESHGVHTNGGSGNQTNGINGHVNGVINGTNGRPNGDHVATNGAKINGHGIESNGIQQEKAPLQMSQPSNSMEADLQAVWSQVLQWPVSKIPVDKTFMALGGDSLSAMQVVAKCRKVGIEVRVAVILQKKTIAAIAPHCLRRQGSTPASLPARSTDGVPFDLNHIQKRYFEQQDASGTGWSQHNQSLFCRIEKSAGVSAARMQQALEVIVRRHSMLRARFTRDPASGQWRQMTLPPRQGLFRFQQHSINALSVDKIEPHAKASSTSLDIVHGPVFSADYFHVGDDDATVFLVAHHLVVDIVSWQVILQDLNEVLQRGGNPQMAEPANSITFQQWCTAQQVDADARLRENEDVFPFSVPSSSFEYWGLAPTDNIGRDIVEESFELPAAASELLLRPSSQLAAGADVSDVLVGSLLSSFRGAFQDRAAPTVFVEHHGREGCRGIEPIDVVGWFTVMYPVHIPELQPQTTALEAVRRVKDYIRTVPGHGGPYFARRHLTTHGARDYRHHDPVEIMINYHGNGQRNQSSDVKETNLIQVDSRINVPVADASPMARRWAMIQIEVDVADTNNLRLNFQVNRHMAHLDRVRQWIVSYLDLLDKTAHDLVSQQLPNFTLSDFPLLQVSYEQLTELTTRTLPQLNIDPRTQVEDIMNAVSYQRVSVEGHLASPPRHWIQYYVELPRGVDLTRLQRTCEHLLQQHSVLRTVFVEVPGAGFAQVILKSMQAPFEVYDTVEGDEQVMERCTTQRYEEDLAHVPSLGQPCVRFMVVQTVTSTSGIRRQRLLMRLSHAQFDGYSRLSFIRSIAALYAQQAPPVPAIGYAAFIREMRRNEPAAKRYWSDMLRGSEPTRVLQTTVHLQSNGLPSDLVNDGSGYPKVIHRELTVPPFLALQGVTSATVFNAACALLLRSLTKSQDVVFGRLTSGRAALPAQFQELVGPCCNLVPVRVQFDQATKPVDVLHAIHQQHLDSLPHETLALDSMIRDCTSWPATTSCATFPVVTQYLNQADGFEADAAPDTVGKDFDTFAVRNWDSESVDPFPWSLCLGGFPSREGVRISIAANSKWVDDKTMDSMLHKLVAILGDITCG